MPRLKDHDEMYLRHFLRESRQSVRKPSPRRHFFLDLLEAALNANKKPEVKK